MNAILIPDHLHKLSKQDVFNIVWEWSKSHERCLETGIYDGEKCVYRNNRKSNSCLVGALIPDAFYDKYVNMRRNTDSVYTLWNRVSEFRDIFDFDDCQFLSNIQAIHDMAKSKREYCVNITKWLDQFAYNNNLTVPKW